MRRSIAVLSFVLLAACGQSGDLYLPPEPPEPPEPVASPATPAAGEAPKPSAQDDDEKKKD